MSIVAVDRHDAVAPPTGPAVVLVHSLGSSGARDWPVERWVAPLTAAGRAVIRVDLPGHGGAGPISERDEVTPGRIAAAIAAELPEGPVDLVGYSLGARIAWALAGVAPVRRLVLGGLAPREPFGLVDLDALRALIEHGTAPADPVTGMIGSVLTQPGADGPSLVRLVAALAAEPFDPAVGAPTATTLVVAGSEDPIADGGRAVAAALPDARPLVVPGDHLGALAGEEFRAAVFDHLGAV